MNTIADPEKAAACPRCGEPALDYRYCPRCGLAFTAPDRRSLSTDEVVGLALLGGGALVVLVALLLPWLSVDSYFSASFWSLSRFTDAATTVIGVALVAVVIADLVTRNIRALRATAVLGGMYFVAFLPFTIEEMVEPHRVRAGSVVALIGTLIATSGLVVVARDDLRNGTLPSAAVGRRPYRTAAILASAAGILVTLMQLLPVTDSVIGSATVWELYKVNDIVSQVLALALVGCSLGAIFGSRRLWAVLAMLLASYFSLSLVVNAIEFFSYHESSAAEYVGLLTGFVALAASGLLAIQVYPRRG